MTTALASLQTLPVEAVVVVAAALLLVGAFALCSSPPASPASSAPAKTAAPASAPAAEPPRLFTSAELAPHTGAGGSRILIGVDGVVFDMSSHEGGPAFYGPGGPYENFAGRDASVGLATMQTDPAKWAAGSVAELSAAERDVLRDWFNRFRAKYRVVGAMSDGSSPKTLADLRAAGLI
jgi:membrane-associated progesterone receptor component